MFEVGSKVRGLYFGKYPFTGEVLSYRFHDMNPSLVIYQVRVDNDMLRPGNGLLPAGHEFILYHGDGRHHVDAA